MRPSKSIAASLAFGLALAFAAEAQAGQIPLFPSAPGQHFGPSWNYQQPPTSKRAFGLSHRPSPTPWNLRDLLKEYGRRTQTPWSHGSGFGGPDWNFTLPKPTGLNHPPKGPDVYEPEEETIISESHPHARLPDPEIPAVPEPDALALLGAGLLGLMAARAVSKKRQ